MTRNEKSIFTLGKERPGVEPGEVLPSEKKLFDAKKIFLFCEGKTEYNYFTGFVKDRRNSRIEVIPRYPNQERREGPGIKELVEQVLRAIDTKTVNAKREGRFRAFPLQDIDEFKILFDRDANFEIVRRTGRSKYEEARELIDGKRIELFLSNYSFEVWILCHFKKPDRSIKSTELRQEICRSSHWERYSKNDVKIFSRTKDHLPDAMTNASKLLVEKRGKGIEIHSEESNPVTEIGILVTYLVSQII